AIWLSRRPLKAEIDRLKDDIHALLGRPPGPHRLVLNGRHSDFVDIAASVNRLIDREQERRARVPGDRGLFDVVAETLPEIMLVHTDTILYANGPAGALFGVEPKALVGKPVTDLLRPAYRETVRKHIDALLEGEEPQEALEVQLISGEEPGLWAELHSRRMLWHGRPTLLTIARDISPRKSIEASLGRSKLQARITLESIGEGVITTGTEGTIDYMNEAAEQLIGTTRSFAVGKELGELIALVDEVDRVSLGDPVQQCLSERRRVNLGRRALLMSKVA